MTLLTHLNHQLIGFIIEDEKIIADEKIIDLLQVNNFLYSWFVKKNKDRKKNIYRENKVLFNFTVIFLSIFLYLLYKLILVWIM